jgi:pimeloyl-ACP methyl ester carboxylesterase
MASTAVNGIDIHYEVSGVGPTFIWLHGLIGSIDRSRAFGEGMDGLAERGVRLLAWEARGHGESGYTENEADYTWTAHANDLRALVDALGIERACFGGSSMGAWVSTMFAIENPERVDRLVVVAPPPLADAIETAQQVFCGLASLVEAVGVEQAAEIVMKLPQYAEMEEKDPKQFALTREWMRTLRAETAPYAIRGLLNGPQLTAERFGEIRVPTLIVAHPDDPIHPASSADALHAAVAGSQLVMAPDMDHFRTYHDELIDSIATFLTGASSTK